MAPGSPAAGPGRRRAVQVGGAAAAAAALAAGGRVGVQALRGTEPEPARSNSLVACDTSPLTCNGATPDELRGRRQGDLAVEADIENWNVASLGGSLGPTVLGMGSVLPYTFTVAPDFSPTPRTPNLLADARLTDPTTVVYTGTARRGWDDGTPVSASTTSSSTGGSATGATARTARATPGRLRPDRGDHRQPQPRTAAAP